MELILTALELIICSVDSTLLQPMDLPFENTTTFALIDSCGYIGYITFNILDDHTDLLFLEIFDPHKGNGYSRLLLDRLPSYQPVHLCPINPESESFFKHMHECGVIGALEII